MNDIREIISMYKLQTNNQYTLQIVLIIIILIFL